MPKANLNFPAAV